MSSDSSSCALSSVGFGNFEFDWSEADPLLRENSSFREEVERMAKGLALEMVTRFLGRLGQWIFSNGEGKPQGVMIRCHVAFWDVLPYLRRLKQTELTELMGLKFKQSVGREVSDFRDKFGWRNGHMQSEKAREVCREREQVKREGKATNEV